MSIAHRGPTFLSSDHAIAAAVRGEGVALGRSALVADDLAAGRLVRPFAFSLPAGFAYYVVYPPRALQRPEREGVSRLADGRDAIAASA